MSSTPVIGLVGSQGAYGRWLREFFEQRMLLPVIGFDTADPASESLDHLLDAADVLLFTAPIRHTVSIIDDCVARSAGRERGRLWLDITSIKQAPGGGDVPLAGGGGRPASDDRAAEVADPEGAGAGGVRSAARSLARLA